MEEELKTPQADEPQATEPQEEPKAEPVVDTPVPTPTKPVDVPVPSQPKTGFSPAPKKGLEDKVLVDRTQLDDLLKRVADLESGKQSTKMVLEEPEQRTAKVAMFDSKYVIGWTGMPWEESGGTQLNPGKDNRLFIELILFDGKEETTAKTDYLRFINDAPRTEVSIIKQENQPMVREQGTVEVKQVEDYKTVGTGIKVPMKEVQVRTIVTVRTQTGIELVMNTRYLNP